MKEIYKFEVSLVIIALLYAFFSHAGLCYWYEGFAWVVLFLPIMSFAENKGRMYTCVIINTVITLATRFVAIPMLLGTVNYDGPIHVGVEVVNGLTALLTQSFILVYTICLEFACMWSMYKYFKNVKERKDILNSRKYTGQGFLRGYNALATVASFIIVLMSYSPTKTMIWSTITLMSIMVLTHFIYTAMIESYRNKRVSQLLKELNKESELSEA